MVYDIKGNKTYKLLPDILKRVKIRSGLSASRFVFDKYNVKEGEKPEDVAFKYYGDAQYHWVIMIVNNLTILIQTMRPLYQIDNSKKEIKTR